MPVDAYEHLLLFNATRTPTGTPGSAAQLLSAGAESTGIFASVYAQVAKSTLSVVNGHRLDLRGSECCADSQSAAPHLGGTPSDTGLAH